MAFAPCPASGPGARPSGPTAVPRWLSPLTQAFGRTPALATSGGDGETGAGYGHLSGAGYGPCIPPRSKAGPVSLSAAQSPAFELRHRRNDGSRPVLAVTGGEPTQPVAEGSITDFDGLVTRYQKQLFNVIFQWIGDYEEARDLTQETFLSAYKAREQFRGDSRIYTWLYRIAHNHCKNRFKQRDRQRLVEGVSLDAGVPGDGDGDEMIAETREIADWSFSPSRLLEQKELRALVDRAVDSLASEYKVVLILREIEGLSYNEIAEVTGLTMEAVKTRLNRARGMVRQRVEPYYKT